MPPFAETELILTSEKKVYHLNLQNDDIAGDVILVGDQNRVAEISKHFEKIIFKTAHREFITHTGLYKNKPITVISTGIGTDNIDIVLNELDAAVNIDPDTRTLNAKPRHLNIYRLGTCGGLQEDLPVNTLVTSTHGIGLDGLLNFYSGLKKINENKISEAFIEQTGWLTSFPYPYCIRASEKLLQEFSSDMSSGMTATAPGFYGPQGREIRLKTSLSNLNESLSSFRFNHQRIVNFEMETSALYGLGKLLGHECLTVCVIIANRARKEFTTDYKKSIDLLIENCLQKIKDIA